MSDEPSRAPERPVDRLLRDGAGSLSDAELVAVLLQGRSRNGSASDLAHDLLRDAGGLAGLVELDDRLLGRPGIGKAQAATLFAVRELAARFTRAELLGRRLLDCPGEVASYLMLRYWKVDQEVVGALFLDSHRRLIAERELFRGTLVRTSMSVQPLLRAALHHSASSFILFHTHPSGDPLPSADDHYVTRAVKAAAQLVDVELLDHLIIGGLGRWASLRDLNQL